MFDCYDIGNRAILVYIYLLQEKRLEDLQEFTTLVSSLGVEILRILTSGKRIPNPRYFIREGKVIEIAEVVKYTNASVVFFNHTLSPTQERNLEYLFKCRVIDRTGLILNIFSQRARTHEGKLQVELAKLYYLSTRLVRGWTHLERQKGGIGLRGPGETQLEIDRRFIRERISKILSRLRRIEIQRDRGCQARKKAGIPTISLIGYTNSGKSTLFNLMTSSKVYVSNHLFSTLDPTLRRINISDVGDVVLADTVGFIRHLPHDLVASFKATLKETQQATLLLHVIDISDTRINDSIRVVEDVLKEIGVNNILTLQVMNKIDLVGNLNPRIDRNSENKPIRVWISAKRGEGLLFLLKALTELLSRDVVQYVLRLPVEAGYFRNRFYQLQAIKKEWNEEDGSIGLVVRLPIIDWKRLCKQESKIKNYIV